jgi:hypothetical protein
VTGSGLDGQILDGLVAAARARGWRAAVDAACASTPELHRYATDPREGDWLLLVPTITPTRRALFVGNALAIVPSMLAGRFASVVVADHDPRRLAFARERMHQDGLDVTCVDLDGIGEVARRDGGFDLVVLGEEHPDGSSSLPFADFRTVDRLAGIATAGGCLLYGVRWPRLHPCRTRTSRPWKYGVSASLPTHVRELRRVFSTVTAYWRSPASRPYHAYIPLDGSGAIRHWMDHAAAAVGFRARAVRSVVKVANRVGGLAPLIDNFVLVAQRG